MIQDMGKDPVLNWKNVNLPDSPTREEMKLIDAGYVDSGTPRRVMGLKSMEVVERHFQT